MFNYENSKNKIETLSVSIEEMKQELKNEYLNMFSHDSDIQEALQDLDQYGFYRYTRHGLVKSVPVDAEDFDETAAEALQDFMEDRGVEVDLLLGYLNKPVKDYLLCMQDDRSIQVVYCENREETTLLIRDEVESEEERNSILTSIAQHKQFSGLTVVCDEVGNVRILDLYS